MKLSQYFLPVLKEDPREAEIISHKLMLRSGMIHKLSSGLYNMLPYGLALLDEIIKIIDREHAKENIVKLLMPICQPERLWQESGRFDTYGKEMLKVKDRHDNTLIFGPTNEEIITDIFRSYVKSHKELPVSLYQIQWKFRDEIRPRFGVMRGREFLMKDAYSFDLDAENAFLTYQKFYAMYLKIFKNLGLQAIPVKADNGEIGGDLSHEFHILAETGESEVFCEEELMQKIRKDEFSFKQLNQLYAAADEMHKPDAVKDKKIIKARGIEVGHIFNFADKYSKSMQTSIMAKENEKIFPNMGSYGIGVSRLMAAIIESSHDERGIILPQEVAPFKFIILNLNGKNDECNSKSLEIYKFLNDNGYKTLLDDSDNSIGQKFSRADLIGIPFQIIIGPKILAANQIEIKIRKSGLSEKLSKTDLAAILNLCYN